MPSVGAWILYGCIWQQFQSLATLCTDLTTHACKKSQSLSRCASVALNILLTGVQAPYTQPWDPRLRPATDFLPLTTGIAADNTTGNEPSQIHLTIAGPNAISVNWATGKAKVCQDPLYNPCSSNTCWY